MLDRKLAPPIHEIREINIPRVSESRLSNGIPFYYLNAGTQPVCKLEIIVHTGKWHEPKPGVSWLACRMLQEGTANLTSYQISELIDQTGSYLGTEGGVKHSVFELYFLKNKAHELIPLLSDLIFNSVMPEDELNKLKQILVQNIKIELEKNNVVASRLFRKKLFGQKHPYGSFAEPKDVDQIILDDVVLFYKEKITNAKIEILASGLIDNEITELVESHFGKRPVNDNSSLSEIKVETDLSAVYVEKEDSTQTSVRLGSFCLSRTDPDFHKLQITNEILGGYFGSRLMQNIRETKGLTYGIYSQLAATKDFGYFMIGADAKKELRETVIDEIFKEVELLRKEGVTADELTRVRNYLMGEFLGEVNTPFHLAGKFKSIHLNGLGYDFYDRYFETLRTIEPEDIQEIAQRHFDISSFVSVSVG